MAVLIWIRTAFSVVPQNFLILRCCFSHLKNLCKALHKFFYDKYIVMRSDQKSTINYQYDRRILLRSTSHNEDYFFSPLSQSLRFLLPSQDLSESRLGVRFIYAFSRASRFAFESARA